MKSAIWLTKQSLIINLIAFSALIGAFLYVNSTSANISPMSSELDNYLEAQILSCALKAQANAPRPQLMMSFLSGEVMEYRTPKENDFIDFLYQQFLESIYLPFDATKKGQIIGL